MSNDLQNCERMPGDPSLIGDHETIKAVRLMRVWRLFSDGGVHRRHVLAAQLSISKKTLARDIELLRDMGCDFESNRTGMNRNGLRLVKVICPCCGGLPRSKTPDPRP